MKSLEGEVTLKEIHDTWSSQASLEVILFAIVRNLSSSVSTIEGYLGELPKTTKNQQYQLINKASQANAKTSQTVLLIENLQLLGSLQQGNNKSLHIEQLLEQISRHFNYLNIKSHTTYKRSLVYIDVNVLASAIGVILTSGTSSKIITTQFRKRGEVGVLEMHTKKANWIYREIYELINSFNYKNDINKNLTLIELVSSYALAIMSSQGVNVRGRMVDDKQRLYVHIPLVRQLSVFDDAHQK